LNDGNLAGEHGAAGAMGDVVKPMAPESLVVFPFAACTGSD
jgi:hypothetical protein